MDQGILAECAQNINIGVMKCISSCNGSSRMIDGRFAVSIAELNLAESSALFLVFLARQKYINFTASHGISTSGHLRMLDTKLEINTEAYSPFQLGDLEPIWIEFSNSKIPKPKKIEIQVKNIAISTENQLKNFSAKKLREIILFQAEQIKELNMEILTLSELKSIETQ